LIDDTADADATNTHSKEPVKAKEKLPLFIGTEQFEKALDYINGGGDIDLIAKKYILTDAVKEALINNK
jgi:hypothetical protein